MYAMSKIMRLTAGNRYLFSRQFTKDNPFIKISEEVRNAIESKKPVVALESTIVTHGMPFPNNVECALAVEKVVRDKVI